jgi:hypothetical protein
MATSLKTDQVVASTLLDTEEKVVAPVATETKKARLSAI